MRNLEIDEMMRAEKSAKRNKKIEAAAVRPKNVLEAFEHIVELAAKSNLDEEFFKNAGVQIRYASRKLKLTPMQTVFLAIFVDRSEDQRINISEIASYAGCRTTRIIRLSADVDELVKRNYLKALNGKRSVCYRVPKEVLDALRANEPYVFTRVPVADTQNFFDRFKRLMAEKSDGEVTHAQIIETVDEYLEDIRETGFATALRRTTISNVDKLLFIYMAHLFVENNDDDIRFSDLENLYDNDELPGWVKQEFRARKSSLFDWMLIENVNEDGMASTERFKLTESAKDEFLGELNLSTIGKNEKDLVKHDSFAAKSLVYNPEEKKQIADLGATLSPERFAGVRERLVQAGMRPGFCCLFYGAPGTGKTETVYQLARQTGRDIMRVDVDKIKSCWVGESEKNIKKLFDRYRNICKSSKVAPILLFNEADAVLGVRMEGAARAVEKMENSIQNIILQEMESIDGIMIATTNLTTNLDKAFERRFLYKVRFEKPTVEARAKIWQDMLKGLSEENAMILASQFDFSGGEIENIARKQSVSAILSGNETIDMAELIETCRQERISSTRFAKIGF